MEETFMTTKIMTEEPKLASELAEAIDILTSKNQEIKAKMKTEKSRKEKEALRQTWARNQSMIYDYQYRLKLLKSND